ncbi:MAG: sigma-70 family RNA polymerase sigma factor [Planctomycetes bacterium]|nr:sigma-70 family RNA polymerase sigma factor [Planctomycetota bacterium]
MDEPEARAPLTHFPSTFWTVLEDARRGDPEALERFVLGYRAPVLGYLHRKGFGKEAEDLAQEIFLRLATGGVLARIDPRSGRFRDLVRAVTRNVVGHHVERELARKRGGGKVEALGEREVPACDEEKDFDEEWTKHLLDRSLGRLAAENQRYHDVFRLAIADTSHADIAARLGITKTQVKDAVYRAKKRLANLVQEEIREYCSSEASCAAEIERLGAFLPR